MPCGRCPRWRRCRCARTRRCPFAEARVSLRAPGRKERAFARMRPRHLRPSLDSHARPPLPLPRARPRTQRPLARSSATGTPWLRASVACVRPPGTGGAAPPASAAEFRPVLGKGPTAGRALARMRPRHLRPALDFRARPLLPRPRARPRSQRPLAFPCSPPPPSLCPPRWARADTPLPALNPGRHAPRAAGVSCLRHRRPSAGVSWLAGLLTQGVARNSAGWGGGGMLRPHAAYPLSAYPLSTRQPAP